MAVLGNGGKLELRREAPAPCVIRPEDLNQGSNSFEVHCEGYWPGDHVIISGPPSGLPILIDGNPQVIDGVASYFGGDLFVAANRSQITAEDDTFYKTAAEQYPVGEFGDDANFYYVGQDGPDPNPDPDEPIRQIEGYLCVDSLGNVRLYSTRCEGLSCCGEELLDFGGNGGRLDFDYFLLSHVGSTEYNNAVLNCTGNYGEYVFNDVAEDDGTPDPNRFEDSICADPPTYQQPEAGTGEFDNADVQPRGRVNQGPDPLWRFICDLQEWSLELDAPSVDTTGVGEKFGEAVKSLVTGGGSADFFIDRTCFNSDRQDNGLYMMQLLLMTERGATANARFYLIDRSQDQESCQPNCSGQLPGMLWYETQILITRNAVNIRPTELVAGTAQFVTTGEIRLLQGRLL